MYPDLEKLIRITFWVLLVAGVFGLWKIVELVIWAIRQL